MLERFGAPVVGEVQRLQVEARQRTMDHQGDAGRIAPKLLRISLVIDYVSASGSSLLAPMRISSHRAPYADRRHCELADFRKAANDEF